MATIRTRAAKGSDLTPGEADANFEKTVRQVTTTASGLISDNRGTIEGNHATTPFTITLLAVATAAAAEPGDYSVTITNIGAAVVTVDANGSETINGSTDTLSLSQYSSVTVEVDSAGTGWQITSRTTNGALYPLASGTVIATTSGTAHNFTSIPSHVKRITVMLSDVSTDGTANISLRIGDSGGLATTGYQGYSSIIDAGVVNTQSTTTSFVLMFLHAAASQTSGVASLSLIDSATNTWTVSWSLIATSGNTHSSGAGRVSLSGTLDRVSLFSTDTFDDGKFNILYE